MKYTLSSTNQKEENVAWSHAITVTGVVFLAFIAQHYIRRFGQPFADIYFDIIFAAVGLTGLAMITAGYLMGPLARIWPSLFLRYRDLRKQFGLIGLALIALHVVISLAVMTKASYPKMFSENDALSTLGEISMLTASVAFVIFLIMGVTSLPSVAEKMNTRQWLIVQHSGLIALILSLIHFSVFKWQNWITFDSWRNGLPSGTFVILMFVLFTFLMRIISRVKER